MKELDSYLNDCSGIGLTLEKLIMGVTGTRLMWRALAAASLPHLNGYDFEELQCRAEQIERIDAERLCTPAVRVYERFSLG